MNKRLIPQRGDVYWIDPNPIAGREMSNKHRFVVITPKEINALGVAITVPVTTGGKMFRELGITVAITGYDISGVAVCNQVRSFDIEARVQGGSAKYIERLNKEIMDEIISRVVSVIDPAE